VLEPRGSAGKAAVEMNPIVITFLVFGSLAVAIAVGRMVRRRLPDSQLSADSKDTVKLAMGLVATMTALLLSLMINSAQRSYDATRGEAITLSAKMGMLDRVLGAYGEAAAPLRERFRATAASAMDQI